MSHWVQDVVGDEGTEKLLKHKEIIIIIHVFPANIQTDRGTIR